MTEKINVKRCKESSYILYAYLCTRDDRMYLRKSASPHGNGSNWSTILGHRQISIIYNYLF